MLWLYSLENSTNPEMGSFFVETLGRGDARSCSPWQFSARYRLTDDEIYDYCNAHWALPENLENFSGLEIERLTDQEVVDYRRTVKCQ